MIYENREEGVRINLTHLTEKEKRFYQEALAKFHQNLSWLEFEEFALGRHSPVYEGRQSRVELRSDPLFLALSDMWSELGVRQGAMARATEDERREFAKRREESRRRQTAKKQHSAAERHVAAAH